MFDETYNWHNGFFFWNPIGLFNLVQLNHFNSVHYVIIMMTAGMRHEIEVAHYKHCFYSIMVNYSLHFQLLSFWHTLWSIYSAQKIFPGFVCHLNGGSNSSFWVGCYGTVLDVQVVPLACAWSCDGCAHVHMPTHSGPHWIVWARLR